MRKFFPFLYISFAFFVVFLASCKDDSPKVTEGVRVFNFGLYDHTGDFHRLYYHDEAEAIVLFVQGNGCPIVRNGIHDFDAIQQIFSNKDVVFYMINSNMQDTRSSIAIEAEEFNIKTPILVDENQLVADMLDIDVTAEAILIDPSDWSIKYRGPINDRIGYGSQKNEASKHFLVDAINAKLSNLEIAQSVVKTKGCAVQRRSKFEDYADLTYTDDIAPILEQNCFRCHQKGGIAPWPMDNYTMVVGWSAMIKNVLREQRMPPWQADPHYGTFTNDISLNSEEIRSIITWIDNGMKKGEGEDVLATAELTSSKWSQGDPDYILTLEQEDIPATGIIDYRYQTHDFDFPEDVYLAGYQVIPGDATVLHHVLGNVVYPDGETFPVAERKSEWLDGILFGWAPGGEAEFFPEGSGRRIPKGSKIAFQNHYTTSGKEASDVTRIGLYFSKEKPKKEYITIGPANFQIKIPPHQPRSSYTAVQEIDEDIILYNVFPHMHYRGRSMNFVLVYPDGEEEMLLNVPGYDFNWQRFYNFEIPKSVPAGSRILVNAIFDNSEHNDFNPDPKKTIYFGDQTFDEMLVGYMSYTLGHDNQTKLSSLTY